MLAVIVGLFALPSVAQATTVPANTVAPSISGAAIVGTTMFATTGTWTGTLPIAYTHQWQSCNAGGTSCSNIAGEVYSNYLVVASDIGKTVRVIVTGTNAAGGSAAVPVTSAVIAAATAPVNTSAPFLNSASVEGDWAAVDDTGVWTGSEPIAFTYQWQRCNAAGANCANIAGQTQQTYTLAAADAGGTVRVVVTATNAGGSSSANTDVSPVIAAATGPPVSRRTPWVYGDVYAVGAELWTDDSWAGALPMTRAYQWQRCDAAGANCANIAGQTQWSYTLAAADAGGTVRVVVTATNAAGSSSASSYASSVIAFPTGPPVSQYTPVLHASSYAFDEEVWIDDSWAGALPMTRAFKWQRCNAGGTGCSDIVGATSVFYDLAAADAGGTVRVVVTATNSAGSATATSAVSPVIAAPTTDPPSIAYLPPLDGYVRVSGDVYIDQESYWSGGAPITYTYQWQQCNSGGTSCVDAAGQTGWDYVPVDADLGRTVRVVVTATNNAGSSKVRTPPSAVITAAIPPPHNTDIPVLSGQAVSGGILSATSGQWTDTTTISYGYQWERCDNAGSNCVVNEDVNGATYALTAADVGFTVRVDVYACNADDACADMESAPSGVVTGAPPPPAVVPVTPQPAGSTPQPAAVSPFGQSLTQIGKTKKSGGKLVMRIASKFSLPAGTNLVSACSGKVTFSTKPTGSHKTVKASALLKSSKNGCQAAAKLKLTTKSKNKKLKVAVSYPGSQTLAAFKFSKKIKVR